MAPKQTVKKDEQYRQARRILEAGTADERRTLAADEATHPEVLYYLSQDEDKTVRRLVASNPATPSKTDLFLSRDEDEDVRIELARKIARLIPGLTDRENSRLKERTLKMLEDLADDTLPKVRAMLSEELKHSRTIPPALARRLAKDVEEIVSCPILEYSPLLDDDALKEIIAAGITKSALTAIARRSPVSEDIANDIAASLEIPAVAALLANPDAAIREETLDQIIEQAKTVTELHKPLALRPALSIRAMKRIAGFVASALVHRMVEKHKLDDPIAEEVLDRVRHRISSERLDDAEKDRLAQQARDYFMRGMLTDSFIRDAIESNQRQFLIECLSQMANLQSDAVRQILNARSGRAITSLAWKAGLEMRTAFQLQTELALVSPPQLLTAKEDGAYPMEDSEMIWQLSYFTE